MSLIPLAVWLLSMILPAVHTPDRILGLTNESPERVAAGYELAFWTIRNYDTFFVLLGFFWGDFANFLILMGAAFMLARWYRVAVVCGVLAVLDATLTGVVIVTYEALFLIGYWVWLASHVTLLALALWFANKRKRPQKLA